MGEYNWAALAIPVFLGATLLEARIAHRRNLRLYAFGTAVSDLACGSMFQAGELVLKLLTLYAYAKLYETRLIDWPDGSVGPWILGILGVDFLFYWWHRVSHVVNVMWAVHGVHHQSEDYNLAVALRQPLLEPLAWFPFYAGLALLGVSPVVYLIAYAVNRVYQFWIHTELVRKLPAPFEWLFNTPSHHRVHHGVQPQYLDKNFGAVLMLWDRLFGTFEPEIEPPVYGTTVPLRAYSPLWANFEHIQRIRTLRRSCRTWPEAWYAWIAHPAWTPRGATVEAKPSRRSDEKYRPRVDRSLKIYVVAHLGLAGLALTLLVFFEHALPTVDLVMAALVLGAAFTCALGLIENRVWAFTYEPLRLGVTFLVTAWLMTRVAGSNGPVLAVLVPLALVGIASLAFVRSRRPSPASPTRRS